VVVVVARPTVVVPGLVVDARPVVVVSRPRVVVARPWVVVSPRPVVVRPPVVDRPRVVVSRPAVVVPPLPDVVVVSRDPPPPRPVVVVPPPHATHARVTPSGAEAVDDDNSLNFKTPATVKKQPYACTDFEIVSAVESLAPVYAAANSHSSTSSMTQYPE